MTNPSTETYPVSISEIEEDGCPKCGSADIDQLGNGDWCCLECGCLFDIDFEDPADEVRRDMRMDARDLADQAGRG